MSALTLSIITATSGRPTLGRALAALAEQIEDGDELIVMRRDHAPWGNATRDEAICRASGTHLWWMDDDDLPTENALKTIRDGVAEKPDTVHIFRIRYEDQPLTLWRDPVFRVTNIGGSMCVVPNLPDQLGTWRHEHSYPEAPGVGRCGDFHFLKGTLKRLARDPIFHREIIARVRVPA